MKPQDWPALVLEVALMQRQALVRTQKNHLWPVIKNLHHDYISASTSLCGNMVQHNKATTGRSLLKKHLLETPRSLPDVWLICCIFLGITGPNKDAVAIFSVQLLQLLIAVDIPCLASTIQDLFLRQTVPCG